MLHKTKAWFEKLITPLCIPFEKGGVSPNWITLLGLVIILGCSAAFAFKKFYLAVLLGAIGGIFDGVDGKVARDTGKITLYGGFWDSVLDRFSEIAIGFGILMSFVGTSYFFKASLLVFLAITGALMTSYVRARGQGIGCDPKEGLLQRADRGLLLGICALLGQKSLLIGVALAALMGYITVFQRMWIVWRLAKAKTESIGEK